MNNPNDEIAIKIAQLFVGIQSQSQLQVHKKT
jgi:hypothetical protein